MRYIIDHDFHIHSRLSSCSSDPEQMTERILKYASENGFNKICISDHYWDSAVSGASDWYQSQNFDHIKASLPLPQSDSCKFLFACETDMDKNFRLGIPKERYDDFDFIIVPTTHLHMTNFTYLPEEDNVKDKARLYVQRFEAFLDSDLPFHKTGIAHLTANLILAKNDEYFKVLDSIDDATFKRLFARCAELGCGVELNIHLHQIADEKLAQTIIRPYLIAKEQGCKFYLGSDAHHPYELDEARERFERIIDILDLSEDDKFHIGK